MTLIQKLQHLRERYDEQTAQDIEQLISSFKQKFKESNLSVAFCDTQSHEIFEISRGPRGKDKPSTKYLLVLDLSTYKYSQIKKYNTKYDVMYCTTTQDATTILDYLLTHPELY